MSEVQCIISRMSTAKPDSTESRHDAPSPAPEQREVTVEPEPSEEVVVRDHASEYLRLLRLV